MNKLREKLGKVYIYVDMEPKSVSLELIETTDSNDCLNELEQITDDFSCQFAEWLLWQDITQRGKSNFVCWDGVQRTTTELQQYFKENVYGK